jgi:glycosyltransferase involved in cell wall biosynthesis
MISIILSVFNTEKYLLECLQSIENQTYTNWELVIINDGSTDNSHPIIVDFIQNLSNKVQYFHLEKNKGLPYCLNLGIQHAKGIYIARIDADDIMMNDRLEKQVIFLQQNPTIDILGTTAIEIDENGNEISVITCPPDNLSIKKSIIAGGAMMHPMLRKSVFSRNIGYRDLYPTSEDRDLWLRLSLTATFANLIEPLVKRRTHKNQITMSKRAYVDSLKASFDFFLTNGILFQNIPHLLKPLMITFIPNFLYVFIRNLRKQKRKAGYNNPKNV